MGRKDRRQKIKDEPQKQLEDLNSALLDLPPSDEYDNLYEQIIDKAKLVRDMLKIVDEENNLD